MNLQSYFTLSFILKLIVLVNISKGIYATTFTFTNKCDYTIWPGILSNSGTPKFPTTGFELPTSSSQSFQSPTGFSGRFWGRTGCKFSPGPNPGYCSTGDCGSGSVECNGSGAEPPATLIEFTLGSPGNDFYDVSLVDGYNLPVLVEVSGGSGQCASTGCIVDLNRGCPEELKAGNGDACKSACEAFGSPEYCCSGAYGTPSSCRPSVYSMMFKSKCPRSYSYAYDDATSTFTCNSADYTITFCPSSPSQKSSRDATTPVTTTPVTTPAVTTTPPDFYGSDPTMGSTPTTGSDPTLGSTPTTGSDPTLGSTPTTGSGVDMTYGSATDGVPVMYTPPSDESGTGTGTTTNAMLSDGSWLAGLAMGDSRTLQPTLLLALGSSFFAIVLTVLSL